MRLGLGISIPGTSGLVQAAFSPLDLSPVVWLDASDTSTITEVGGAVSQWDDKSGNGNDVVQATAALQPTTGTRTVNSLNVLDFTSDALSVSYASSINQPGYVFLVASFDSLPASTMILFDSNTGTRWQLYKSTSNNWTMNGGSIVTGSAADTNVNVITATFDGASSSVYVNQVSKVSGDAGSSAMTGLVVGAGAALGANHDGIIAEMIIVSGTLTAGEISDTESYLADKWGITL